MLGGGQNGNAAPNTKAILPHGHNEHSPAEMMQSCSAPSQKKLLHKTWQPATF
jgi:hypothetical protein